MKDPRTLTCTLLLLTVPIFVLFTPQTGAMTRAEYPANYEMQDNEPSLEDQWDLDVVQDDQGRYYAVWADLRELQTEVRFSKSLDGTSWGDGQFNNNDKVVSDLLGAPADDAHPSIAVDSSYNLTCVWIDTRGGYRHLRISWSGTAGNTWSPSEEVQDIGEGVQEPYIRYAPDDTLILVYGEERAGEGNSSHVDIMMRRSAERGKNFTAPLRVVDDTSGEDQVHPRISISDGGVIGLVWEDYRNGDSLNGSNSDIYFSSSTDGGLTFSPNHQVSIDTERVKQQNPDLAFSKGGDIMVVWEQQTLNGWRVHYTVGWLASEQWNGDFDETWRAVEENISRLDQFKPSVGYVDGAFVVSWTELDIRDFILVRAGFISRAGGMVQGNHVIDNTISLGRFVNDPDIFIAEMHKETVCVLGFNNRAQVFWIDHRTDPNPSNDLIEDGDPYTARVPLEGPIPPFPETPVLSVKSKGWDRITVSWKICRDIEFEGYYLVCGRGTLHPLDQYRNNFTSSDRYVTEHTFTGLEPLTTYTFRLMVMDDDLQRSYSGVINVSTNRNLPPSFQFLEPDGNLDQSDRFFDIIWTCSDPEENANVTIHYIPDTGSSGQVLLYEGNSEDNGGYGSLRWNTTGLSPGGYILNATIRDRVNRPVTVYSYAIIIDHPQSVVDHPRVVGTSVSGGGRYTALTDSSVRITFDSTMSIGSMNDDNLFVLVDQNKVPGSISQIGPSSVEWVPDSRLRFSTIYTLVINPSVTNMDGDPLDGQGVGAASSYRFVFSTRSDEGVPEVVSFSPQSGGMGLRPQVEVEFDIPLDPANIDREHVMLHDRSGRDMTIDVDYDPSEYKIMAKCRIPLEETSTYRVTISGLISSAKGVKLGSHVVWNFTTGEADLVTDTDGDGVPDDLDMFHEDPSEWEDLDGDRIGDNADLDDDGDAMEDEWELKYGLDPKDPYDAEEDPDGDGKTNLEEFMDRTNPKDERTLFESMISYLLWIVVILLVVVFLVVIISYIAVQRKRIEEKERMGFYREE